LRFHDTLGKHAASLLKSVSIAGGKAVSTRAAASQPGPAQHPASAGLGPERCPQCNASFANVAALIHHVESSHAQSGAGPVQPEQAAHTSPYQRCPECGEGFSDPIALVQHVQRHRYQRSQPSNSSAQCVIS
jgi:uncharacterized C2H2 Zn-finger protein